MEPELGTFEWACGKHQCAQCGKIFSALHKFHKFCCKKCGRKYYYINNKEKERAYYFNNKEHYQEYHRERRAAK